MSFAIIIITIIYLLYIKEDYKNIIRKRSLSIVGPHNLSHLLYW